MFGGYEYVEGSFRRGMHIFFLWRYLSGGHANGVELSLEDPWSRWICQPHEVLDG